MWENCHDYDAEVEAQMKPKRTDPTDIPRLEALLDELEAYRRAEADDERDTATRMAMLREALGTRDVHGDIEGIARLIEERDKLRARVVSVETEAAQAIARASQLAMHQDSTRSKIEAERDRLRSELAAEREDAAMSASSFASTINDLSSQLTAANDTNATLRAELAAKDEEAKEYIDYRNQAVLSRNAMEKQLTAARDENAGLREALGDAHEGAARQLAEPRNHDDDQYALTAIATVCENALARTPSQHRARIEAVRKQAVAEWIENEVRSGDQYYERSRDGMLLEAQELRAEADRLECGE